MFANISYFLLIVAAALSSIVGNSLVRLGMKKNGIESLDLAYLFKNFFSVFFQPLVLTGFIIFVIGMIVWMRVLSISPLSKSYPIFTSLVILFLITSSALFLHEPISLPRLGGMALIAIGTFLVFAN